MSVRETGIDLNGASVTLQRSLYVLHFLESVAHVAVGIGKCRLDPETFIGDFHNVKLEKLTTGRMLKCQPSNRSMNM